MTYPSAGAVCPCQVVATAAGVVDARKMSRRSVSVYHMNIFVFLPSKI